MRRQGETKRSAMNCLLACQALTGVEDHRDTDGHPLYLRVHSLSEGPKSREADSGKQSKGKGSAFCSFHTLHGPFPHPPHIVPAIFKVGFSSRSLLFC